MINIFTYIIIVLLFIILILMEIKLRSLEKDINKMRYMIVFLATEYIKKNEKRLAKDFPEDIKRLKEIRNKYGL